MTIELIEGDCREVLREFANNSIDSVVTDPPYALTMTKRLSRSNPVDVEKNFTKTIPGQGVNPYRSQARGFMGKAWDNGDTAFDPAFWADVLRVLKPGGHVLSFGGTRTYHRMACAIEDAGFEIRDQIGWLYGSGFPKSSNQDGEWEGWGTALKPAWEPIVVARKPLVGTVAGNLAEWGVGALNIDGCRVPSDESTRRSNTAEMGYHGGNLATSYQTGSDLGRWPANVIHDGSDEVLDAFPQARGAIAGTPTREIEPNVAFGRSRQGGGLEPRDSGGSAARFFYCAKASKKDRGEGNVHPTVKPTDLMRYLVRLVTPPNGTVLDPFMGSGSTGRGAVLEGFNFIGIEMSTEYMDIADARIAAAEAQITPVMQAAE